VCRSRRSISAAAWASTTQEAPARSRRISPPRCSPRLRACRSRSGSSPAAS
jgi:hypothetical protein